MNTVKGEKFAPIKGPLFKQNNDFIDLCKETASSAGGVAIGSSSSSSTENLRFKYISTVTKEVQQLPYYHGLLPDEDIRLLLKNPGDFVLRFKNFLLLSVLTRHREMRTYSLHEHESSFLIEKTQQFESIKILINAYIKFGYNVEPSVKLEKPIIREKWELTPEDIDMTKKIEEGAFSEFSLGRLTLKGEKIDVAIKLVQLESLTKEQFDKVMGSVRLLRKLDHPNVMKVYGVVAGQEPLMLVMELADKGALDSYLQKNTLSPEKKTEICAQASYGIEYLHHMQVLHCDIAARNCLYVNGTVKLNDKGSAREGPTGKMDNPETVHFRWLAPETMIEQIYNVKTDIYSFGLLCWEIWHNGNEPYPDMTVEKVCSKVKEGFRMTLPPQIPNSVRIIILNCWQLPDKRWTAAEIAKKFEEISGLKMPEYVTLEKEKKQQHHVSTSSAGTGKRKKSKTSRDSVKPRR